MRRVATIAGLVQPGDVWLSLAERNGSRRCLLKCPCGCGQTGSLTLEEDDWDGDVTSPTFYVTVDGRYQLTEGEWYEKH